MKTKKEIKNWLLENAVDKEGDLDLSELDFSDFDGDVYIGFMKVKNNLYQNWQEVGGYLDQSNQKVESSLWQSQQKVQENLIQNYQKVEGDLDQSNQKVEGDLDQSNQKVKENLWQNEQEVKGRFITQTLKIDEKYEINNINRTYIVKAPKELTLEELKAMLGFDFKIVEQAENEKWEAKF